MKRVAGAIGSFLLCVATGVPAAAQDRDAMVLPRGVLRAWSGGTFFHFDSRFAEGGDSAVALGAELLRPLTSASFPPLLPLERELGQFFAATASQPDAAPVQVGPETLRLGTPDVRIAVSERTVPFGVRLGVLPRVELGVTVPIVQRERLVQRAGLAGSTVGLNPDAAGNRALLAELDEAWATLGGGLLLPTDSSALGRELQRRVRALTGSELELPVDSAVDGSVLNQILREEFGLPGLESGLGDWELGDVEVEGRFQLIGGQPVLGHPFDSTGVSYRTALSVGVRLPTGSTADSLRIFSLGPSGGRSGVMFGVENDVFAGTRFWGTLSARLGLFGATELERRIVSPESPFSSVAGAVPVRWSPGSELEVRAAPRYRLTEEIAIGGHYTLLRVGGSSYEGVGGDGGVPASLLDTEAATLQRGGAGLRYSTLRAYAAGRGVPPVEFSLDWTTTFAGAGRAPVGSAIVVQGSLFRRLWGGGR